VRRYAFPCVRRLPRCRCRAVRPVPRELFAAAKCPARVPVPILFIWRGRFPLLAGESRVRSKNREHFLFCFLYFLQNPRFFSLFFVFSLFCSRDLPGSPDISRFLPANSRDLPEFAGYLPLTPPIFLHLPAISPGMVLRYSAILFRLV